MTISIFNCIQNTLTAFEADEIKKVFKIGDSKNNFYQHCSIVEKGVSAGDTVFNRIFTDACIARHIHPSTCNNYKFCHKHCILISERQSLMICFEPNWDFARAFLRNFCVFKNLLINLTVNFLQNLSTESFNFNSNFVLQWGGIEIEIFFIL